MTNGGVVGYPSGVRVNSDPWNFGLIASFDPIGATTIAAVNANRALYARVAAGGSISKIRVLSNVQSGNVCVGVYRNSGIGLSATPGILAATSGSVGMSGGTQDFSLNAPVTVNPGDWFAIACDNGSATFYCASAQVVASTIFGGRSGFQDTAFPLLATATMTVGFVKSPLLVGVP